MADNPELETLLRQYIKSELAEVNTCLPAEIVSFDAKKKKASVQPLINRKYSDGTELQLPVINNVPVQMPSGGGAILSFPVKKGDSCMLVFSQRSLDKWLANGGIVTPDESRKHDLNDAIAIMGLDDFTGDYETDENDVLLKFNQAEVRITKNGEVKAKGSKFAAGSQAVELVDVVSQCLQLLSTATTLVVGVQVPAFAALKAQLDTIKTTL